MARLTRDERREQLLNACAAIVDVEGFPGATIDRVARDCGVTRTVVYQLFGSLDGLLEALVQRASHRALDALQQAATAATNDGSPMATILDAVDADPQTWRMFLVAPQLGPPALADHLAAGRAMIRAHNDAARNHPDPELAARLLQAMADELVRLRLADPSFYPTERLVAAYEGFGRRRRYGARRWS